MQAISNKKQYLRVFDLMLLRNFKVRMLSKFEGSRVISRKRYLFSMFRISIIKIEEEDNNKHVIKMGRVLKRKSFETKGTHIEVRLFLSSGRKNFRAAHEKYFFVISD